MIAGVSSFVIQPYTVWNVIPIFKDKASIYLLVTRHCSTNEKACLGLSKNQPADQKFFKMADGGGQSIVISFSF